MKHGTPSQANRGPKNPGRSTRSLAGDDGVRAASKHKCPEKVNANIQARPISGRYPYATKYFVAQRWLFRKPVVVALCSSASLCATRMSRARSGRPADIGFARPV